MDECKVISIKWKEQDEIFKKFNETKRKYDQNRLKKGDKETSCVEFARKLIIIAMKHADEIYEI